MLQAIDFDVNSGQLTGLGTLDRLYILDPVTGLASLFGNGLPLALPAGIGEFFDINPVTRVISLLDPLGLSVILRGPSSMSHPCKYVSN